VTRFRPRRQLAHLTAYGVDFVVVGGIAATLHGSDRVTFDLDICPSHDPGNLDALGRALVDLDARLRGVDDDVAFVPDGRTLAGMQILTLDTSAGPLDVLIRPDGSPPYDQLRRRAKRLDIGPASVLVASVEDLLEMKRGSARGKDKLDVETLEAIKRLERRVRRKAARGQEAG
jgi:hypothetical protein